MKTSLVSVVLCLSAVLLTTPALAGRNTHTHRRHRHYRHYHHKTTTDGYLNHSSKNINHWFNGTSKKINHTFAGH